MHACMHHARSAHARGGCRTGEDGSLSAYDAKSSSVIKLNNGIVLYLRQVNT